MSLELLDDFAEMDAVTPPMKPISLGNRIASMFFEYLFLAFLFFIISFIFGDGSDVSMLLIFTLFMNKDIINGKSIFKRLNKSKLIDIRTGEAPPPLRASFRNITCIFSLFEVFVAAVSPQNRRLGDYLCRTMIVEDYDAAFRTSLQEELKSTSWENVAITLCFWSFLLGIGLFGT